MGEKHNCVVDTREPPQESSGTMSLTGGKLPLPDLPQQTPACPLPAGVSLLVASPLAHANADPGFPQGLLLIARTFSDGEGKHSHRGLFPSGAINYGFHSSAGLQIRTKPVGT